ncbi:uncharacterized protein V1510DRAFT_417679 [Dipodascopsis tothii]|uniref:uncharacterized protein n=1 Tax=Dipodascopsis tothii TaxID=44089 RepID=UPI0034CDE0F3
MGRRMGRSMAVWGWSSWQYKGPTARLQLATHEMSTKAQRRVPRTLRTPSNPQRTIFRLPLNGHAADPQYVHSMIERACEQMNYRRVTSPYGVEREKPQVRRSSYDHSGPLKPCALNMSFAPTAEKCAPGLELPNAPGLGYANAPGLGHANVPGMPPPLPKAPRPALAAQGGPPGPPGMQGGHGQAGQFGQFGQGGQFAPHAPPGAPGQPGQQHLHPRAPVQRPPQLRTVNAAISDNLLYTLSGYKSAQELFQATLFRVIGCLWFLRICLIGFAFSFHSMMGVLAVVVIFGNEFFNRLESILKARFLG